MTKPGFIYNDDGTERRIYYIEKRGKDISFLRWRLTLYYASNFAATALFNSEIEYAQFCANNEPLCYSDFDDFRKDWVCQGLGKWTDPAKPEPEGEDFLSRNWLLLVRLQRWGYSNAEAERICHDLEEGRIQSLEEVKPQSEKEDEDDE